MGKENIDEEEAIVRWEKAFDKKMNEEEAVMFRWGYTYAINDALKVED